MQKRRGGEKAEVKEEESSTLNFELPTLKGGRRKWLPRKARNGEPLGWERPKRGAGRFLGLTITLTLTLTRALHLTPWLPCHRRGLQVTVWTWETLAFFGGLAID